MISNVLSRMIDNGFNLKKALKDEKYLQKNIKNFDTNVIKIKELIGNNFAYEHHEYEVYSEPGYYIGIFHKGFYLTVYFHENFYDDDRKLYNITVKSIGYRDDFYSANYLVEHIYNIESQRFKLVTFDENIVDTIFKEIKSKQLQGIYEDMDDAQIELKAIITSI